ncbi:MAG: hypothetical protein JZU72_03405, partial [Chlorobium phaeobacteroides]|nr:hypothetical protein [Chlorobium phaeobacteroides]
MTGTLFSGRGGTLFPGVLNEERDLSSLLFFPPTWHSKFLTLFCSRINTNLHEKRINEAVLLFRHLAIQPSSHPALFFD